jgi:hypothetical protein
MFTALLQMGRCLVDQRRSLEAKTYLQQALKINKKTLGLAHRHTADTLYSLGICLGDLGLWESGLKHLDEALSARKAAYGEGHINVGWVLYWCGVFLKRCSHFSEAEYELRKAQSIVHQHKLLPSHPLALKVEQELKSSVEQQVHSTPKKNQEMPVISVTDENTPTHSRPHLSSHASQEDRSQMSSRVSEQTERTSFSPSDLPMKFRQSPSISSTDSMLSLDTGYLSLSRSPSLQFGSTVSLLERVQSNETLNRRWRYSMASKLDCLSLPNEPLEITDRGVTTSIQLKRTQSHPVSSGLSVNAPGLESALSSLMQPSGVYWSGGTLEMIVTKERSRSMLTSYTSVIGPSGGRCGSDSVFVNVPSHSVAMPTKVCLQTYSSASLLLPKGKNEDQTVVSPIAHISLSPSRFKQPVELHLPIVTPLVSSVKSSGWLLELKVCDASSKNQPYDWYTALEFNTNTGCVTAKSNSIDFDQKRQLIYLKQVCWVCWVGRLLGIPAFGQRNIAYSLFGKQLEEHKWTVSVHIMDGSNVAYDIISHALIAQKYITLKPPAVTTVGLLGDVLIKVEGLHPWTVTDPAEAQIPTQTIWDVPVNGSLYFTATVENPTLDSSPLECTMTASFKGEWLDVGEPVTRSVFRPSVANLSSVPDYPKSTTINFTYSHITGLAFGPDAHLLIEQANHRKIQKRVRNQSDLFLRRNIEITPEHIPIGVPVRLAIHLPSSEKLITFSENCFVQFVSDQGEADVSERPILKLNEKELDVLCPAWPCSGRVFVRIVSSTQQEEIGVGFVTVGEFC